MISGEFSLIPARIIRGLEWLETCRHKISANRVPSMEKSSAGKSNQEVLDGNLVFLINRESIHDLIDFIHI